MAIRAPQGTTLEVPDPDEGMPEGERRYQIYLKSPRGPIDVYVVSKVMVMMVTIRVNMGKTIVDNDLR